MSFLQAITANITKFFGVLLSLLFVLPIAVVVGHLFVDDLGNMPHLMATVLPTYISNSIILMISVGGITYIVGSLTAWLSVMYQFPGHRLLDWALILPLAIPSYVLAYAYTDFLQFSGPLQMAIRDWMGYGPRDFSLPNIRSLGGAIIVFSVTLYPYVYLTARASFLNQSRSIIEAARTLGSRPLNIFLKVALPASRPALIAGVVLVLMETLADFGAVSFFGVPTFTTGIYRTWFSLGDPVAAAKLATMLLAFVALLIFTERWSRSRRQYYIGDGGNILASKVKLRGWKSGLAFAACIIPVFLGFILPVMILVTMSMRLQGPIFTDKYYSLVTNTLTLGGITAFIAVGLSLMLLFFYRMNKGRFMALIVRICGIGYAIPGSIIAVGVLIPFAFFDNAFDAWLQAHFGVHPGLLLTGTIVALVFAYLVRFLSVSLQTIDAGYLKIQNSIDDAARTLGAKSRRIFFLIHIPLLKGTLLTAFLMVVVDVMKELPATLIMRPFNFDTLAVVAHNYAADERLAEAAIPALTIVAVGLLPVLIMSRMIAKAHRRN